MESTITIAEIYFLVRVGTWDQVQLADYISQRADAAYHQGVEIARADSQNAQDIDYDYNRGFDDGHNEGYRDGYADGSREAGHDTDQGRW